MKNTDRNLKRLLPKISQISHSSRKRNPTIIPKGSPTPPPTESPKLTSVETLRTLDGKSTIAYAVDRDWIGKNGVIQTSLGKIDIADSRATSEVLIGGQKSPGRFQFKHEEGSWKFDLVSLLQNTNLAMKAAAKQAGISEDEFLFTILESISGKKVDENIWTPPN